MDWDEIFPSKTRYNGGMAELVTTTELNNDNLRAHLIASWVCIERLKKQVKQLQLAQMGLCSGPVDIK